VDKLSTVDSTTRLGHYVAVLASSWTSVVDDATELHNELDETLEVQTGLLDIIS